MVAISKILTDLPAKLPAGAEREFLNEALACYRAKAYRAAVVMAWNLAYDHLMQWVLNDSARLQKFNSSLATKFPKKGLTVSNRDDILESLKESEMREVCRHASLITKNTSQILEDELRKRNRAAHPSGGSSRSIRQITRSASW